MSPRCHRPLPSGAFAALACVAGLSLFCHAGAAQAADSVADSVADTLYQSVMAGALRYTQYNPPKALAGCFDWQRSTPDNPNVQFLAVATRGRGGWGSVSAARLASNTFDRCERARQRHAASCACHVIDRNGRNWLEPPDDFVQRFR